MIQTVKPLFPNYLFAKIDLDLQYAKVKWTRGVSRSWGIERGQSRYPGLWFRRSRIGLEKTT